MTPQDLRERAAALKHDLGKYVAWTSANLEDDVWDGPVRPELVDALRRDVQVARKMGYSGKFAIHPSQIDVINEIFSPSEDEVGYARQVVQAWNCAEAEGRGSADLDGRMIDVPVIKRAQNLLAFADAIRAQG